MVIFICISLMISNIEYLYTLLLLLLLLLSHFSRV